MSTPRTGTISVPRSLSAPTVRSRLRGGSRAVGVAVVRTPELTIGALAVVATAAFSWVPSVWYDEAATVTSATRSWPQLWAELHSVDAVHGLYYALMHAWFWLVGYTPFTLRFPSALAIGVAAGLVVALGRRLGGRRLGIVAGLVFLALPRVQWAGGEGRPYATITALSVCLTLVGLTAVRRTRSGRRPVLWWSAYGVLALVSVTFNIYLSLAVVAHAVALLWVALAERRRTRAQTMQVRSGLPTQPLVTRRTSVRWLIAAGAAALIASPFVLEVASQSKQVGWIAGITDRTKDQVFATAWFGGMDWYAAVAWALLIVGVVTAGVQAHRRSASVRALVRMQAVRVALPLVIVPTAALVGATALGEHLYSPKYASLSLPFVALLMALAITLIRPKAWLVGALAAVLLLSVPNAYDVKTPLSKQDSTWANAASIVAAARDARPDADEGVIYGSVYRHPGATADIIRVSYPWAFTGMTDLGVRKDGAQSGVLWNQTGDLATTVPARLGDIDTVWFVGGTSRNIEPQAASVLSQHGFVAEHHWKTGEVLLTEYVRAR
ncbi:glycosyltransferase family 39 protein [Curtobacterium sp. VKM Ac-2922]|uniref:glycosyltransferase family 39 protein n=1 Tax=Curtobacterium sp. VKM Ac-2922 TaxID=2929475 RepID=UPI001FB3F9A0|nr:glycosyltransferase family 39 protein [Curtobacterium sp. VKM Ac-2922]MCJ1714250.1 glycosyltransferase family 39 protein [Curtobacterium sp. VKM Ac-2922]